MQKGRKMSDRAFVYAAIIIIGTLAISLDRAYQAGLGVVLWLSAALVLVSIALVLRFVRPGEASPLPVAAHAAESPRR